MEDKDKLENLRFLSESHRKLHQQRRLIELRVLLTTLSLYALAAFAVLKGEFKQVLSTQILVAICSCFFVVGLLAVAYLNRIHNANRININLAEAAERGITELLDLKEINDNFNTSANKRSHPKLAWFWQTAIILVVGIGSAMIIFFSAK